VREARSACVDAGEVCLHQRFQHRQGAVRLPLIAAQNADPLAVQRQQPRCEMLSDLQVSGGIVEFQLDHDGHPIADRRFQIRAILMPFQGPSKAIGF
jgi:hypothetical protein